ncbi:MAG: phosphatase PAP2 family protein [Paludibacteraceae bacterium]
MIKSQNKDIWYFLIPYLLFFLLLLYGVLRYPKADLHLMMNFNHTSVGDWFFRVWTEFGGGWVPFVLIGLLLFYRYSIGTYLLSAQLLGGIISFIGKRIFNEPRPLTYFHENFPDVVLSTVQGVDLYRFHSFPSGHTITGFALFFGLALLVKNKWLKLLFFIMAALVGYSRVYLSQHFAIDILVGSAIGIICAWMLYPFYLKLDNKWGRRSLSEFFQKKSTKELADNQK